MYKSRFYKTFGKAKTLGYDVTLHAIRQIEQRGRAPWSCGLICHVLDREVGGSNLGAAFFFWTRRLKNQKTRNEASHLEKNMKTEE